jgi:WD40 repeat protein
LGFDQNFNIIKQITLSEYSVSILSNNEENSKFVLLPTNKSKNLIILDSESLEILSEIQIISFQKIKTVLFNGDNIFLSNDSGILQEFNLNGLLLKEYKIPNMNIKTMVWASKEDKIIWIVSDESLTQFKLGSTKKSLQSVSLHALTCCGVDISEDGKYLVSGDFKGNLILWDIKDHHSLKNIQLKDAIRCLRWKKNSNWIQIGCLNGTVYNWNIETDELNIIVKIRSKIICMDWENSETPRRLAIGTKDGELIVVENSKDEKTFKTLLKMICHPPVKNGEKNGRFGTIGMYSEIWSVKWSPKNDHIATSSEDQTTKIWSMKGDLVQTLTGHTTAVTSVDWSASPVGEILVTCADDKRVMIWQTDSWKLHHEFNTYHIEGWHTLTYIALEKSGKHIVATTQHGYLIAWCVKSKKKLYEAKIHSGSIEGLKWNHNSQLIGTVSSDCTVNVFDASDLLTSNL